MKLAGAFIQGQLFGELADLIFALKEESLRLQDALDVANGSMARLYIPMDI
jgi:hypothetical protein